MIKECKVFLRDGKYKPSEVELKTTPVSYIQEYNYKYGCIIAKTEIVTKDSDEIVSVVSQENLTTLIAFKPEEDAQGDIDGLMFELRHNLYKKISDQIGLSFKLEDYYSFSCKYNKDLELRTISFWTYIQSF